jgi:hypothetical protein
VDDAVERCKQARGAGVAGFANALLRRLAREGEPALPDAAADPAAYLVARRACRPGWRAAARRAARGRGARVRGEHRRQPPVTLRANTGASRATSWRRG